LLIVGDGPDRERLERLAADAPHGSVVFAGQVSESDLPRYYRAGDVFAMPAGTASGDGGRGLGQRVHEAAACGRPVVVGVGRRARVVVPGRPVCSSTARMWHRCRRPSGRCSRIPRAPSRWVAPGENAWNARSPGPGPPSSSPDGSARPSREPLGSAARARGGAGPRRRWSSLP
jgi:hypothetical protein